MFGTYGIQGHPLKDPIESESDSECVTDYESHSKTEQHIEIKSFFS